MDYNRYTHTRTKSNLRYNEPAHHFMASLQVYSSSRRCDIFQSKLWLTSAMCFLCLWSVAVCHTSVGELNLPIQHKTFVIYNILNLKYELCFYIKTSKIAVQFIEQCHIFSQKAV